MSKHTPDHYRWPWLIYDYCEVRACRPDNPTGPKPLIVKCEASDAGNAVAALIVREHNAHWPLLHAAREAESSLTTFLGNKTTRRRVDLLRAAIAKAKGE
jgi:hypothetical protein